MCACSLPTCPRNEEDDYDTDEDTDEDIDEDVSVSNYDQREQRQHAGSTGGRTRTRRPGHGKARRGHKSGGRDTSGHDPSGHDPSGYDESGYDESGYDEGGYDESGYDESGHITSGTTGGSRRRRYHTPDVFDPPPSVSIAFYNFEPHEI
uniref:Uncharacterized protein n=1 Tax=Heliothis virescens TaxID=7102 RepID=A0A2A4J0M5_HELVI